VVHFVLSSRTRYAHTRLSGLPQRTQVRDAQSGGRYLEADFLLAQ